MDTELYDRQIRTYGIEASKKIHTGHVYIIGIDNDYAKEIVKNLALSGVSTINLIGTNGEILKDYIHDINSTIIVNIYKDHHDINIENSCLVIINKPLSEAIILNDLARTFNIKTVYMTCNGLSGSIFVDAINHTIIDEDKDTAMIKDINKNKLFLTDTHTFNVGDQVKINNEIYSIIDTTSNTISINSINNNYINNYINYIPKNITINHKKLSEYNYYNDNHNDYHNDINIPFVTSIMGGFATTEIIKLISNKYTPINQSFHWSDNDLISDNISIESIHNNLNNSNILIVGCGALGCEWLKNLSLMAKNIKLNIDIIDPDHIEKSNLSRQLLFRDTDIGQSKCLTAIKRINNSNININGYVKKLIHTDVEFINSVFKDKHIVINALDNMEARKLVDSICFQKNLPLFESGTMGMKCNSQPVIPFITECYSSSNDSEDIKEYPACTIKFFPNLIQHTIHWARDYFELFNRGPINCNNYQASPDYLNTLSENDKTQANNDIKYFLSNIPNNKQDCYIMAKKLFDKLFIDDINELLKAHPDDNTFWTNGKVCPKIINYENDEANNFINATVHILCQIYNIPKENNNNIILNPMIFEKDDSSNWHVEWITYASNCRALNYGIKPISVYETKGIAGKIIPAVAATTSTIVGLIGIELLKYINNIQKYRSYFLNMADNTVVYSEPLPMKELNICGKKINGWTKFNYNKNSTLNEFIKYYENIFKITIEMVLYKTTIIYANFIEENINKQLSDIFNNMDLDIYTNEVSLIIMTDGDELPEININLC